MTYKTWLKKLDACTADAKQVTKGYYVKRITLANFELLWEKASLYHKKWILWKLNGGEEDLLFKTAFPKGYKKRCAQKNCSICASDLDLEKLFAWENAKKALVRFLRRMKALPPLVKKR